MGKSKLNLSFYLSVFHKHHSLYAPTDRRRCQLLRASFSGEESENQLLFLIIVVLIIIIMLPVSNSASLEQRLTKKSKDPSGPIKRNNSLGKSFLQRPYISYRCIWLLFAVLSVQILIILSLRRRSLSSTAAFVSPISSPVTTAFKLDKEESSGISLPGTTRTECDSGLVYVYEMPDFFNSEILRQCDNLNPWSSRCGALLNEGFGKEATSLSGVVPDDLVPAWFWTDQFVSEIIFHNRILSHKCRVLEPESATAFYIPFYAGLAVGKYLWSNYSADDRDNHCRMMIRWVQDQPHWNRSNGWDHFITMGRITWDFRRSKADDWGSSCIHMPGMRNVTRLLIERNPWDYFDVGVPYPTGFHPRSDSDVTRWQEFVRTRRRRSLFCFAGAARQGIKNDFRELLFRECRNASGGACRTLDCTGARCANGTSAILETFLDSDFCLQPRGDSFTRRSIFDCMVAGSIPVFFWHRTAYMQYQWFLPEEPESYSVFLDREAVKNGTLSIKDVLERYSREDVRKMREKVIECLPRLVYAKSPTGLESFKDAFDVAIDGVLRRFKEQENWYKWR